MAIQKIKVVYKKIIEEVWMVLLIVNNRLNIVFVYIVLISKQVPCVDILL